MSLRTLCHAFAQPTECILNVALLLLLLSTACCF